MNFLPSIAIILLLLAGCSSNNQNTQTGQDTPITEDTQITDDTQSTQDTQTTQHTLIPAISGLAYQCGDSTGLTQSNGEFECSLEAQDVSFSLGATALGSVTLSDSVTIQSLFVAEPLETQTGKLSELVYSDGYNQLFNLFNLLYFLDYDDDISNGIEITAEIAQEIPDFDLNLRNYNFPYSQEYRTLFIAVNNNDLLPNARQEPNSVLVMSEFYDLLNLAQPKGRETVHSTYEEIDYTYDVNGLLTLQSSYIISGGSTRQYLYDYDVKGNKLQYIYDSDTATDEKEIKNYAYNSYGLKVSYTEDSDGDGTIDQSEIYTYDNNFNRASSVYDHDNNGSADYVVSYEYNEDGLRKTISIDGGANGTIDVRLEYLYDEHNNRIQQSSFYDDVTPTEIITNTYNSNGDKLTELRTENNLTVKESRYTYDTNFNKTSEWKDSDGDGDKNYETIKAYDERGNLILEREDANGDDDFTYIKTITYNANNQILTEESNSTSSNYSFFYTYTYDENGNRVSRVFNNQLNSTKDYEDFYTYDDNQNLIHSHRVKAGSPTEVFVREYRYNAEGYVTEYKEDSDGDEIYENVTNYTYSNIGGWYEIYNEN